MRTCLLTLAGPLEPKSRLPIGQAIPTRFHDKDTVAVVMEDVFIEGAGAVPYTACDVVAIQGFNTDVCIIFFFICSVIHVP